MKKKCKACKKEMTEKEYIQYLEREVLRLEQELAIAKLSGTITIPSQPAPWVTPKPFPGTIWNTNNIGVPTGDMCCTSCGMYRDKLNACVSCGKDYFGFGNKQDFYKYVVERVKSVGAARFLCTMDYDWLTDREEGSKHLKAEGYISRSTGCDIEWVKDA